MNIDKEEAKVIMILAVGWMFSEGQGTRDNSDCKLVLKILDNYPELNKKYKWMHPDLNRWMKTKSE